MRAGILQFVKTLCIAALVVALIPTLMFGPGSSLEAWASDPVGGLKFVSGIFLIAVVVSLVLGLAGALFVGLPTTWLLSRYGWETEFTYIAIGAAAGLAETVICLLAIGSEETGFWVSVLGLFAGGLMGYLWWRGFRRHFADAEGRDYRSSTNRP